jgi:hypothetical protein
VRPSNSASGNHGIGGFDQEGGRPTVRLGPDLEECEECGFAWAMPYDEAVATVRAASGLVQQACGGVPSQEHSDSLRWSQCEYTWHLADAIRIAGERLWMTIHIPAARLVCFDEVALAAARHYDELPPAAAVWSLTRAIADFEAAAHEAPPEPAERTLAVVRRIAHEVCHHAGDMVVERPTSAGSTHVEV